MISIKEIIELLEKCRPGHYTEPEGLVSCPASSQFKPGECDCGADELNAEIDSAITMLKDPTVIIIGATIVT